MIGFRVLAYVARGNVVRDEFAHSREVKTSLDHTEGPMYPPVTCDDGVVVSGDDFLNTVFRDHDFVVCPQSAVLKVLAFVVFELPGCWVEEVGENLGVLAVDGFAMVWRYFSAELSV